RSFVRVAGTVPADVTQPGGIRARNARRCVSELPVHGSHPIRDSRGGPVVGIARARTPYPPFSLRLLERGRLAERSLWRHVRAHRTRLPDATGEGGGDGLGRDRAGAR